MREKWGTRRRIGHVLSFVDSRTLTRVRPRLDLRGFGASLLWDVPAVAGFVVAGSPHLLLRWAGGLVFVYSAIESGYPAIRAAYRAFGFETPRLHDLPIASLSVAELWGTRWARPISAWLRDTCFRPMIRRRRPVLGVVLAFAASGLGHAFPVVVAGDPTMAGLMFGFFVVQGIFVVGEAVLGAARWPRGARRACTVLLMVASSPLFVEPTLRVIGLKPLP
jgi:hypothetical protein